jgi:hypothetical protein
MQKVAGRDKAGVVTHFGGRPLEFAAMHNANLTVFADRNNGSIKF